LKDPQTIADERGRNTRRRAFTVTALKQMGAKPADSQGNFLFADIGMPAKDFRDACAKQGVMVGRDFPPFEKTHCRISIGTMDEMKKATDVFREALKANMAAPPGAASGKGREETPCWHGANSSQPKAPAPLPISAPPRARTPHGPAPSRPP